MKFIISLVLLFSFSTTFSHESTFSKNHLRYDVLKISSNEVQSDITIDNIFLNTTKINSESYVVKRFVDNEKIPEKYSMLIEQLGNKKFEYLYKSGFLNIVS